MNLNFNERFEQLDANEAPNERQEAPPAATADDEDDIEDKPEPVRLAHANSSL
jgi:hypothetical protein